MKWLDTFRWWLQQDWSTLKTVTMMAVAFFLFFGPAMIYSEAWTEPKPGIETFLAFGGAAGFIFAFIWLIRVGEKGNKGPKT